MTNKELKYLEDVVLAINDISNFIGDTRQFQVFNENALLKRAIEREFEIIGEAIRNFKSLNSTLEISHSKEIIGLRNRIVHAYDSVDYERIWSIVINHLPKLKVEIESIIKKFEK